MKKIVITIPQEGIASGSKKVQVTAQEIKGTTCLDKINKLIEGLGDKTDEEPTNEYYEQDTESELIQSYG